MKQMVKRLAEQGNREAKTQLLIQEAQAFMTLACPSCKQVRYECKRLFP